VGCSPPGAHIRDFAEIERDVVGGGTERGPADDVLVAVVEAVEELLDLFPAVRTRHAHTLGSL